MAWDSSTRRGRLPKNWDQIRPGILARDGRVCQLAYPGCSRVANEVDHIVAGDDHSPSNLQAVCFRCHRIKSSREGAAAKPRLHRRPETHPSLK